MQPTDIRQHLLLMQCKLNECIRLLHQVTDMGSSVTALDFSQLPNKAQALICSLASTPTCPSYMLLARVSKSWGQAAAQHLQLNGASVGLQLAGSPQGKPPQQRQHEEQRLASLETWLRQYGHLATSLRITDSYQGPYQAHYVVGRGEAIAEILDALAAAGSWSGGMRLQQLQLPAVGSIKPSAIAVALSGCHQLRELQLHANWSTNEVHYSDYLEGDLPAALQQLQQLKVLRMHLGVIKMQLASATTVSADNFFACLPPSLEVLELESKDAYQRMPSCAFRLCISSLQHLVALRELLLPSRVHAECTKEGATLSALTALTHIHCMGVRQAWVEALLAAPNLIHLTTGCMESPGLHRLADKTSLRILWCFAPMDGDDAVVAVALAQLTMLTELVVRMDYRQEPAPDGAAWAQALSALTGLRSLSMEAVLLQQADVAALTTLTELQMEASWGEPYFAAFCMEKVLRGLTPAHGQLRRIVLHGVRPAHQERFAAAVAAAPVNARLGFV